jgi:hypothetical protein
MKFIAVTKIEQKDDDYKTAIAVSAIVSVGICDEETTWITLVNGEKFLVYEMMMDILKAMGITPVTIRII